MFCTRCGANNLDTDQFCRSCSAPLTKPGGAPGAIILPILAIRDTRRRNMVMPIRCTRSRAPVGALSLRWS